MNEPTDTSLHAAAVADTHASQRRFFLLIAGSIGITLTLVTIAMILYTNSTAIEIDLSPPAYQSVRQQAGAGIDSAIYPSTGEIDEKAIQTYRTMLSDQYEKAVGANGFGSDALSDKALELPQIK